jgi:hypothetical protein
VGGKGKEKKVVVEFMKMVGEGIFGFSSDVDESKPGSLGAFMNDFAALEAVVFAELVLVHGVDGETLFFEPGLLFRGDHISAEDFIHLRFLLNQYDANAHIGTGVGEEFPLVGIVENVLGHLHHDGKEPLAGVVLPEFLGREANEIPNANQGVL